MRLARVVLLAALVGSGCKNLLGIESGVVATGDAQSDDAQDDAQQVEDAAIDVPADARTCFGTFQQICLTQPVPDTFVITATTVLDSATGCTETATVGGVDVCVRSAKHITVNAGATLATAGIKFVVLVATEDIVINGTLDAWGSGSTVCANNAAGTSAGGAGGSFGALGGTGGAAPVPVFPTAAPTTITTYRRGCVGGSGGSMSPPGGVGGQGGTGIFLVSPTIQITSTARINASGFGGQTGDNDRGGGGGGSGGLIVLDSEQLQIDAGALVLALGGGGGGGGGGGPGMNGTRATSAMPGQGGMGGAAASGDGGDGGSTNTGMPGEPGANGRGGGGGGGSTGVIFATATDVTNNGTVVPALRAP